MANVYISHNSFLLIRKVVLWNMYEISSNFSPSLKNQMLKSWAEYDNV